uniref:CSON013694 protein n=1 Tax=Culicoides sonorensis TaxID=179676 RepID=A0A336JZL5_CULSO
MFLISYILKQVLNKKLVIDQFYNNQRAFDYRALSLTFYRYYLFQSQCKQFYLNLPITLAMLRSKAFCDNILGCI